MGCLKRTSQIALLLSLSAITCCQVHGQILTPGDPILAIDLDGNVSNSSYPGGEAPANLLDGLGAAVAPGTVITGTKYLNFGGPTSGFIVTLDEGPTAVQSFQVVSGNDAPGRDPMDWVLYGTNSAIASGDNSDGLSEPWTQVAMGTLGAFGGRDQAGDLVTFANGTAYGSYKMVYPTLSGDTLFQMNDAQFYSDAAGANPLLSTAGEGGSILAIHQGSPNSTYPGPEGPGMVIDGDVGTKYLNFGEENSGFIVTPQGANASQPVRSFQVTTANDSNERDPMTWELWGTDDAILSGDNSAGNLENWVLIDSGDFDLTTMPGDNSIDPNDGRVTAGCFVEVDNDGVYSSYRMVFPTVKNEAAANSMQLAEVQFFSVHDPACVPEPSSLIALALAGLMTLVVRRR